MTDINDMTANAISEETTELNDLAKRGPLCKQVHEAHEHVIADAIVYLVHVYNADDLYDYQAARDLDVALREAAKLCVLGDHIGPDPLGLDHSLIERGDLEARIQIAIDGAIEEPGVNRWHVRRGTWLAHVDRMEILL